MPGKQEEAEMIYEKITTRMSAAYGEDSLPTLSVAARQQRLTHF